MKIHKTKTNFETHALRLAIYVETFMPMFSEFTVDLKPRSVLHRKIQKYLDSQKERILENKLHGIIGVRDVFRNSTGGRIHLIAGMSGPIVEAVNAPVVSEPIDYENKSKYLIRALKNVSGVNPPKVGNIHVHLFPCNGLQVTPKTILEFIRREHGFQNEVQQVADSVISVFIGLSEKPYWRPNADSQMIQALFGSKTQAAS